MAELSVCGLLLEVSTVRECSQWCTAFRKWFGHHKLKTKNILTTRLNIQESKNETNLDCLGKKPAVINKE